MRGISLVEGEKIGQVGSYLAQPWALNPSETPLLASVGRGRRLHHFWLVMSGIISSAMTITQRHKAAAFGGTTLLSILCRTGLELLWCKYRCLACQRRYKSANDLVSPYEYLRLDAGSSRPDSRTVQDGITSASRYLCRSHPNLRMNDGDIFKVMRIAQPGWNAHHAACRRWRCNYDASLAAEAVGRWAYICPEWHGLARGWRKGAVEATLRGAMLAGQADAPFICGSHSSQPER